MTIPKACLNCYNLGSTNARSGYLGFGSGFTAGETLTLGSNLVVQGQGAVGYVNADASGATLINNGNINSNLVNGTLSVNSPYTNGTFINNGTMKATATGSVLNITGNGSNSVFTNKGTLTIATGTTGNITTNIATQSAGKTTVNGTLKVTNSSDNLLTLQGGFLDGTGAITANLTNTGGDVAVGTLGTVLTPGKMTLTGNYVQGATGTFSAAIGGTTQGSQYSFFSISGSASLNGNLDICMANGFVPTIGTFSNAPGNQIMDNGGLYLFNVIYSSNNVKLVFGPLAVPEPGSGVLALFAVAPGLWIAFLRRKGAVDTMRAGVGN